METIFVDWAPVDSKSKICSGGQIRRYYAWTTLNKIVNKVIPFRKKDGTINWKAVMKMFKKDSMLWVEYGCGGVAHLFCLHLFSGRIINSYSIFMISLDRRTDISVMIPALQK